MELKEFNATIGKILGIKGEVKFAEIRKSMVTREVGVYLVVAPTKTQVLKIEALISNGKD